MQLPTVSVVDGINVQPTVESAVQFEVTETVIQPLAASTPKVVVVSDVTGSSTDVTGSSRRTRRIGHENILYATEQTDMYFSL